MITNLMGECRRELDLPKNYLDCSVVLEKTYVRDQKNTGRCWIESGLGMLEYRYFCKTGIELPPLSSAYVSYFDLILKIKKLVKAFIATKHLKADDPLINHFKIKPLQDAGQWTIFAEIINEYGIVFEKDMDDASVNEDSHVLIAGLNQKLRMCMNLIRSGIDLDFTEMEKELVSIVDAFFGEIPRSTFFNGRTMSPLELKQEIVEEAIWKSDSFINIPFQERDFYKKYSVKWLCAESERGSEIVHINIPLNEFKLMALKQLKAGYPVWIGIDAEHYTDKKQGIFDCDLYDFEKILGVEMDMGKGAAAMYKDSNLSHAVLLWGVDLNENKINRWCIKNSFGNEIGQDGYAYVSDAWFDRYVYQIIILKSISSKITKTINDDVIWLEVWDFLGCLAD